MRRLPAGPYWVLWSGLVLWMVACALHIIRMSVWVPVFFMWVLDYSVTGDSRLRHVLSAFLLAALVGILCVSVAVAASPRERAPYDAAILLAAVTLYQFVLWRGLLRRE